MLESKNACLEESTEVEEVKKIIELVHLVPEGAAKDKMVTELVHSFYANDKLRACKK